MPKLIKDWEGLVGLESEQYKLDIDVDKPDDFCSYGERKVDDA